MARELVIRITIDDTVSKQKLKEFEKQVEGIGGSMQVVDTKAVGLIKTIGAAFVVSTVMKFGSAILETANHYQVLIDKTKLSATWLQRFEMAGKDAGVMLDTVADGALEAQKRIAQGKDSLVGALSELHLNLADLRAMKPEDQFRAVIGALHDVPNTFDQVRLSAAIFGDEVGDKILPLVRRGVEDMKDANVLWKDETIENIATVKREWQAFLDWLKGTAANTAIAVQRSFSTGATDATQRTLAMMPGFVPGGNVADFGLDFLLPGAKLAIGAGPEAKASLTEEALKKQDKLIDASIDKNKKVSAEYERQVKALREQVALVERIKGPAFKAMTFMEATGLLTLRPIDPPVIRELTDSFDDLGPTIRQVRLESEDLSTWFDQDTSSIIKLNEQFQHFGEGIRPAEAAIRQARDTTRTLGDSLRSLAHGDLGAVSKDLGGWFKGGLQSIGTGFLEGIGGGILNGITSLIGKGLGALGDAIFHTEAKKVNDMRDQFQLLTFGDFPAMAKAARDAGYDVRDLLRADRVEEFNAEVAKFKGLMDEHSADLQRADELVKEYQIDIGAMGATFRQQKLEETAGGLMNDWRILVDIVGVDIPQATLLMKDKLIDFANTARDTGTSVPISMKPILQQLIDTHAWIDENGVAFENLDQTGLHFGDPIVEGLDRIVGKLDALLERLGLISGAALTAGTAIQNMPTPAPPPNVPSYDYPTYDPYANQHEDRPFLAASGYHGWVNTPTHIVAGEAGREYVDITPAGQMGGGRGVTVVIQNPVVWDRGYISEMTDQIERELDERIRGDRAWQGMR